MGWFWKTRIMRNSYDRHGHGNTWDDMGQHGIWNGSVPICAKRLSHPQFGVYSIGYAMVCPYPHMVSGMAYGIGFTSSSQISWPFASATSSKKRTKSWNMENLWGRHQHLVSCETFFWGDRPSRRSVQKSRNHALVDWYGVDLFSLNSWHHQKKIKMALACAVLTLCSIFELHPPGISYSYEN